MRKLISFMHLSLDGFAAGPKGEMDWIRVDDEIFDYASARTHDGDTALYGRVTFEMMDAYWPTAADQPNPSKHDREHSAWYKTVEKIVISRTLKGTVRPKIRIVSDNLKAEITALKEKPGKDILVFGSPGASHSLMAEDLIDDYWLFVNPVLLGEGIPLFKDVRKTTQLQLITSKAFASGVVCLHYERKRGD
jgi:dihydrofolate reductase